MRTGVEAGRSSVSANTVFAPPPSLTLSGSFSYKSLPTTTFPRLLFRAPPPLDPCSILPHSRLAYSQARLLPKSVHRVSPPAPLE